MKHVTKACAGAGVRVPAGDDSPGTHGDPARRLLEEIRGRLCSAATDRLGRLALMERLAGEAFALLPRARGGRGLRTEILDGGEPKAVRDAVLVGLDTLYRTTGIYDCVMDSIGPLLVMAADSADVRDRSRIKGDPETEAGTGVRDPRDPAKDGIRGGVHSRVRLLEVGCGAGGLLAALADWAVTRGLALDLVGCDISEDAVVATRQRLARLGVEAEVTCGDALDLAEFGDRSFDVAVCTTVLHHFRPGQVCRALSEADRVAAGGLYFLDARRDVRLPMRILVSAAARAPEVALAGGLRALWVGAHDGVVSLHNAYTLAEMRFLAEIAGLGDRVEVVPEAGAFLAVKRGPSTSCVEVPPAPAL